MSELWYPLATRRDGPASKLGYGSATMFVNKSFLVAHSMEGPLSAALGELDNPRRRASWTFSNPKVGPLLEHYPSDAIAWASGSIEANELGVPVEHEGVAGEPLTDSQVENLVGLCRWLQRVYHWGPWSRAVNLIEHKEAVAMFGGEPTACPSGRMSILWDRLIADLQQEEDDMKGIFVRVPAGTTPDYYFVSLTGGYRIYAGLADPSWTGCPVVDVGGAGGPHAIEALWALPSLEEIVRDYGAAAIKKATA